MKDKVKTGIRRYERYKAEQRKERNQARRLRLYLKIHPNNLVARKLLEQLELRGF